ncbi:unnamed protein product [marine sediment metagenome]|uniref:Uncharacterized protein n=1 Tax=marine sediment metagenome TaxID=412755 RepID=X1HU29_9ZZZZ
MKFVNEEESRDWLARNAPQVLEKKLELRKETQYWTMAVAQVHIQFLPVK